jgi:hypothetical protein
VESAEERQQARLLLYYTRDEVLFGLRRTYTVNGESFEEVPCVYCGEPGTTDDHVFPKAALKQLRRSALRQLPEEVLKIVPACIECNVLAANRVFLTLEDKRAAVKKALARRYRTLAASPAWTAEDLAPLQGWLRQYVEQTDTRRARLAARLLYQPEP